MDSLYNAYISLVENDAQDAKHRSAAQRYLDNSSAKWDGHAVYASYMPRILSEKHKLVFSDIVSTTCSILEKCIARYFESEEFRDAFRLDPRIRELIELPSFEERFLGCVLSGEDMCAMPYARLDIFYDEDTLDFKFCEFNADASSGMNENEEIYNAIKPSLPFEVFSKKYSVSTDIETHYDGWVQALLRRYRALKCAKENPVIAIVGVFESDNPNLGEFQKFAKRFEANDCTCAGYDARHLRYIDGSLYGTHALVGKDNLKIDCIWRYSIAVDVVRYWDECKDFISALRDAALPIFGSFKTQLVHDKQLFAVLQNDELTKFLSEEEREFLHKHLPKTAFLEDVFDGKVPWLNASDLYEHPQNWILKPIDWYSCIGVYAGRDYVDGVCGKESWKEIVQTCLHTEGSPYIVQEFCTPYKLPVIPLYGKEEDAIAAPRDFDALTGLYAYNGNYNGVFSRLGPTGVITNKNGGVSAATVWVDDKKL